LPEHEPVVLSPGADDIYSCFTCSFVCRAPQLLAVYSNDLPGSEFSDATDPIKERLLELAWIKAGENSAEGVVGGNTVRQSEKGFEPVELATTEQLEILPGLSSADGGADRDDKNIDELVSLGAIDARIGDR